MVYQITKGIKISVETKYDGSNTRNNGIYHLFAYIITIENKSSETVKLTDRFWMIFDALNKTEIVKGEGVIGQTPTLAPNDIYRYSSGCILESEIGAMKGYYTMLNTNTLKQFKVNIPTFQLISKATAN